jgi:flagellar protein FlaG
MEIRPHTNTAPAPPASADKPTSAAIGAAKADAAPTQAVNAVKQLAAAPSEEQVAHALKSINQVLQDRSPNLEFSVDGDSKRTIVKVVDKTTQEVIRQMPTQEALEIAKALDRLQSLLVKQQA